MSKWIKFGNRILKKRDIDFFTLNCKEKCISCDFHQGLSHQTIYEDIPDEETLLKRYITIGKLLGIDNEVADFSGETRRTETSEERLLGLLDVIGNTPATKGY